MKQPTKPIKAVFLDVDGTLVDTNDAHAKAWVEAFAECGQEVSFEKIRPLIGMGGDQLLPRTVGVEKDSDQGKKYADTWARIFTERYLPHVQAFPQAAELVHRIHEQGVKIIAASSGEEEMAKALLDKVGIQDLLTDKTTSKDAKRSKPASDIVEAALKKAGCDASEALMVGDSPYDIQSTQALGVGVIALRCGGFPDAALQGAIAIYNDPADLLEKWEISPFVKHVVPAG